VPPPPVAGATVGNARGEECVRAGERRSLALGFALGLRLAPAAGDELPPDAADGLGALTAAVWLGEVGADVEAVGPGDSFGNVAFGGDPLQATTDAAATIVRAAKPTAVSPARNAVPAVAVRVFIGLLAGCVGRRQFPKRRSDKPTAIKQNPMCCLDLQWLVYHWTIRLRD
jgi:hypothetical protein